MHQYSRVKVKYPDAFVFMRLGDFYELFGEDAVKASSILEIVLTSRDKGPGAVPMAGVPHHSVMVYIKKLIDLGHTAVIVDQMEDPKQAKGIVKREVTRVITPGTVLEDELLISDRGNALAALSVDEASGGIDSFWGLAIVDISQGTFVVTGGRVSGDENEGAEEDPAQDAIFAALTECERFPVRELLVEESIRNYAVLRQWAKDHPGTTIASRRHSPDDFWRLDERLRSHLKLGSDIPYPFLTPNEEASREAAMKIRATALALEYIDQTNPRALDGLDRITPYDPHGNLIVDPTTIRNLEIFRTLRTGERKGSLLWAIDRTLTPGGKRLLAELLSFPLLDKGKIIERHNAVRELLNGGLAREDVADSLKGVRDIARLTRRLVASKSRPVDAVALGKSIANLPAVRIALSRFESPLLIRTGTEIQEHRELAGTLSIALDSDGALSGKEAGYMRSGYNAELDELRGLMTGGRDRILALQAAERERTGIKNLKVGFNRVFGYYLEISQSNIKSAPSNYIRKQTLANSERYITEELKELESKVLGAEERAKSLEEELFNNIVEKIRAEAGLIGETAKALAMLDVLLSFARLALDEGWVQAELSDKIEIQLKASRHPVLEQTLAEPFIPNDADLSAEKNQLNIITGPNMAGKSTYMRQVALIVLLNQIGSFVPCEYARLGIFDRLFSRVGATDDLALGQSTFMVEMLETAHILHSCTPRSLVILDEIGRGTSTFDGLAIAWSVAEYLANRPDLSPVTLFATHYHELTRLADDLPRGKNWRITLQERGGDIIFLRRVVEGKAGRSYGIEVAKLAGLPKPVIERSNEILAILEQQKLRVDFETRTRKIQPASETMFLPLTGLPDSDKE
ncbi:MAG: DNA mismatch repair protein MutS [bacterium]|nr:DNA mismatch repair protein MutS [bacterium]